MKDILILSISGFFVIFAIAVVAVLEREKNKLRRLIREETRKIKVELSHLHRKETQLKHELKKIAGVSAEARLKSKIAEKYAAQAHDKAGDALARVIGIEKSTHRVQMMPIEQVLQKNLNAKNEFEKVLNPGEEEWDWDEPLREDEPIMPNARLDRYA